MTSKTIWKIILGIVITILVLIGTLVAILWGAFGPIDSSGEIKVTEGTYLDYDQTYMGDFAAEFYYVSFKVNDSVIGNHTFSHMDWGEHYTVQTKANRVFIFFTDSTYYDYREPGHYVLSYKGEFENVFDSTYWPAPTLNYDYEMEEINKLLSTTKPKAN